MYCTCTRRDCSRVGEEGIVLVRFGDSGRLRPTRITAAVITSMIGTEELATQTEMIYWHFPWRERGQAYIACSDQRLAGTARHAYGLTGNCPLQPPIPSANFAFDSAQHTIVAKGVPTAPLSSLPTMHTGTNIVCLQSYLPALDCSLTPSSFPVSLLSVPVRAIDLLEC